MANITIVLKEKLQKNYDHLQDPLQISVSKKNVIKKKLKLRPFRTKCTINGCNNKGTSRTLHGFPSDLMMEQLWKHRLQISKVSKYRLVCDEHFDKEEYLHWTDNGKHKRLKRCALPTEKLPSPDKNYLTCLIPNCETNVCSGHYNARTLLIYFPNEPEKRFEWIQSIQEQYGIKFELEDTREKWICSRHFLCSELKKFDSTGQIYVPSEVLPKKIIENKFMATPLIPETTSDPPPNLIPYFKSKTIASNEFIQKLNQANRKLENYDSENETETWNGIACRLCLTKDQTIPKFSIFRKLNNEIISNLISTFFSINISKMDKVTKICEQCLVQIDIVKSIYDSFNHSNKLFRELAPLPEKIEDDVVMENDKFFDEDFEMMEASDNEQPDNYDDGIEEDDFFVKHSSPVYFCHLCSIELKTDFDLRKHQKFDHKMTEIGLCSVCGFVAKSVAKLRTHEKVVHMKADYHCKVCNKAYNDIKTLNMHKFEHDADYRPICTECGQDFASEQLRQEHVTKAHKKLSGNNAATIKCDCGETFNLPKHYMHHLCEHKTKVGGKMFSSNNCPICDAEFRIHERLMIHINVEHPKERKSLLKYKCDCKVAFMDPIRKYYHDQRCIHAKKTE